MVIVYGLPKCGKCEAAKQKLKLFNLDFIEKDYAYYMSYHPGWDKDESLDVISARCFFGENAVPLIKYKDKMYDYPGLMRKLKKDRK